MYLCNVNVCNALFSYLVLTSPSPGTLVGGDGRHHANARAKDQITKLLIGNHVGNKIFCSVRAYSIYV